MAFWNKRISKDEVESSELLSSQLADGVDLTTLELPTPPEPDLSTKPENSVWYELGSACPRKHLHTTTYPVCVFCGANNKPAVIRYTKEPRWALYSAPNDYHWTFVFATPEKQFVRWLKKSSKK